MGLRPIRLPGDLEAIARVITDSFQYPGHPEWSLDLEEQEQVAETVRNMRRLWPLFGAARRLLPAFRDLIVGAVWEEASEPVGVVLYQRVGTSDNWHIGNVAVLPSHRRRGIARRLVEFAIAEMDSVDAATVTLEVIAGNDPAIALYESMGFERFGGTVDMSHQGHIPDAEPLPAMLQVDRLRLSDWRPRVELLERTTPDEVQRFDPIDPAEYRLSPATRLLLPVLLRATGVRQTMIGVRNHAGATVGWGRLRARRRKGAHQAWVAGDPGEPAAAGWVVRELTRRALEAGSGLKVVMTLDEWQEDALAAATALGYTERVRQHRLGRRPA